MVNIPRGRKCVPSPLDQAAKLHVEFLLRGLDFLVHYTAAGDPVYPAGLWVKDLHTKTIIANSYEEAIAFLKRFDAGEAVLS